MAGGAYGILLYGTTGTLSNLAGGRIVGTTTDAIYVGSGTVTTLSNAGTIAAGRYGVEVLNGATISTLSNTGLIDASDRGIQTEGGATLSTLTNSGTVQGTSYGMLLAGTSGTISNLAGGRIAGTADDAVYVSGNVTSLSNAGTFAGGSGSGDAGVQFVTSGTVGTLTNSGNITGFRGVEMLGSSGLGSLVNSGTISGVASGVYTESSNPLTSLVNAGRIEGATAGFDITAGGLKSIANTGTIAYTGAGTGPAIRVGSGDYLGDATGASGPALTSTGAGALIDGTIVNSGTVFHGFQIENQDVTVSADGAAGIFTSGTLNVVNGNLTTTSGTITLDAAISVNGGTGT